MNKKKAPSKTKSKSKKGLLKKILIPLLLLLLVIGGIAGYMYYKAADTVDKINEPLKTTSTKVVDEKPFTVLLMGIGTQPSNAKRQLRGASDTMVLATVNPSKNEMNLLSIPRDMITPFSGESKKGKISTAYTIGGAQKSVDTVSDLFDVSIDHYVTLNMDGLEQLVDAVDGVTVKNTFEFTQDGFNFPKGSLTLSGEKALSYSLMRYNDPNDDFGRQKRQRQTVDALFVKLVSAKGLMNYNAIMDIIGENVTTNISMKEIFGIAKNYRNIKTVKQNTIEGGKIVRPNNSTDKRVPSTYVISDKYIKEYSQLLKQQLAE